MAFLIYTSWILADFFRPQLIKRTATLILLSLLFLIPSDACNVICRVNLNLSIGTEGHSAVTPGLLLVDSNCDPEDFIVELTDSYGVNHGDTIKCFHIGQTLTAKVIRIADGNFCSTMITVYDNLNPIINCADTTLNCGNDISPEALGYPTVEDNCTFLTINDLSYIDIPTNYSCGFVNNGDTLNALIERRWTVLDSVGNQGTCSQFIRLKKSYLSDVTLPPNLDGTQLPAIDCESDPTDLSLTGYPNINGLPINATNFCDLAADYSDQELNICGAGYLILRTWTMADWCTGDVENHVQFIKVADTTAPVLNCPQDLTISTEVYSCFATVLLPTTTATDNCSDIDINPVWEFGTGFGPFQNVPLGVYPVTYSATDACGNVTSCQVMLTIEDQIPPQVVCKLNLQVGLGFAGQALLPASSLDAGTYDNCILDSLLISRDGVNFEEHLLFDCQDIQLNPITVTMRALDYFGNYNECDVQVTVTDHLPPALICPDSVTISCSDDFLNINITGQPTYIDNCFLDTIFFQDSLFLNTCNVGFIHRKWTVRDAAGLENYCTQRIDLIDTSILNITFPANYQTNSCNPDLSPPNTGEPQFFGKDCEFIATTFNDDTLSQSVPACFIIYRHWEVIDWCSYDANTGAGFWESTQLLSVIDVEDPVLTVPADTTVYSFAIDCGVAYFNINLATATDCSELININNSSPFADNDGADASGNYPIGLHQIYYTAEDNCGNIVQSSMLLNVVDDKIPTAVCKQGLIFTIGSDGTLTVNPEDLNLGSFDNCTPDSLLTYSLSVQEFSCADIGENFIVLYVYDLEGNVGACSTNITIQNNNGVCAEASISGQLSLWSNGNISNANVELSGVVDGQMNTNANGYYQFNNLSPGEHYLIEAFKDGNDVDGISVLDIVLLSRHIVGLASFTNPYQIIAGDIDRDNTLSGFDLIQMQKLILLIDTINPNGDSWRFIPDDFVFSNPSNPLTEPIPSFYEINNLELGDIERNFVGIKLGDVSGNANPQLNVDLNSFVMSNEHSKTIDFFPSENMETFGFHLVLKTSPNLSEVNVSLNDEYNFEFDYYYDARKGEIRIVAYDLKGFNLNKSDKLFSIHQYGTSTKSKLEVLKCQVINKRAIISSKDLGISRF